METTADGFSFHDGDSDPEFHSEGPSLSHFRSYSIQHIDERNRSNWKLIIDSKVAVPTNILRIFDENGDLFSLNDGPEFNENDGPDFNGNDDPGFNGNDGPELNTNVSNNESLSCMNGNVSLTDTNNLENLGISPIRPLSIVSPTPRDVSAESQSGNFCSTGTKRSTPMRHRLHQKQSTPCSSKKSFTTSTPKTDNEDGLEDNCAIVVHEPSEPTQYKSKLAGLISKVIGESTELALFDKFHVQLKAKNAGRVVYTKYKDIEATFQTQVLKKKSAVTNEMRVFEKEFYKTHNSLPTSDDSTYHQLCKDMKYVKTLLRSWKITL